MHRILSLVLLCLLFIFLLTSCFDATEIDEQAFIMTLGIDLGISNKYRITLQLPTMKGESQSVGGGGQGDSGKSQSGFTIASIDAPSFFEGLNMLESSTPRHLNFEQLKYIVISEDMARSGILGEYIAPIRRYGQIRDNARVIISRGRAEEFVNELKPVFGSRLTKSQELFFLGSKDSGFFPNITLEDFYDGFKSTYRQPIAPIGGVNKFESYKEAGNEFSKGFKSGGEYMAGQLPRKGESSIELFGTAVFDGDKMVGELNGDETRFLLMGRGEFERGFFSIPDPKSPGLVVPMDVRQVKSQRNVSIRFQNGKPIILLKLELEGSILAIQSRINYESPELKPVLIKAFEQYFKKGLDDMIAKTIAFKTDVLRFGQKAVWQFKTIQGWESFYWSGQYQYSEVTTEVKFTIKRTGTMLSNSPVITTKGKE